MTPFELAAKSRRKARRFFWTWVGMATLLSIAGNAAHAAMSVELMENPWFRIAVGTVPPLMLAMSAEAVTVLYRNTDSRGTVKGLTEKPTAVWWTATIGVVLLALSAFALSFVALKQLAVGAGIVPWMSWLYPVTLDLSITVGLTGLVAVPPLNPELAEAFSAAPNAAMVAERKPSVLSTAAKPVTVSARPAPSPAPHTPAPALPRTAVEDGSVSQVSTALKPRSILTDPPAKTTSPKPSTRPTNSEPTPTDEHHETAQRLVGEKVARKSADEIARILAMNDARWSAGRIESAVGAHRDVVKKVLAAAGV